VVDCLGDGGLTVEIHDERNHGRSVEVSFVGSLRADQQKVVGVALAHESGVISAPTGFGKTLLACAILASRKVNTLILVHRGQLLDHWRTQIQTHLGISKKEIGVFGKGRKRPTGLIDVATIQSLYQGQKVDPMIAEYGQIIVDECHHVSAFSFEQVLRSAPARYVLGLTATPIRRDGLHPIMFMQCGPLRVKVKRDKDDIPHKQEVVWRDFSPAGITPEMVVTDLYTLLAQDSNRTSLIVDSIVSCLGEGRFPLVLTERKAHLDLIHQELVSKTDASIAVLYGGQGKKARAEAMARIETTVSGPRVVLATGKLVGEGFDLLELDTLFIALPISWRGTLQQYVGRLARSSANKSLVQVHDYQDLGHPILLKMGEKRRSGYRMLGFGSRNGPQSNT
jgi:superfamily II DNA or RNA helicase